MKKQLLTIAILLGLIGVVGVRQTQAQINQIVKVNIPFSFYVGEKELPAGEYVIREKDPVMGIMEISRVRGKEIALFLANNTQLNSTPTQGELMFNRYGKTYFLEKIFAPGERYGDQIMQSKREKKLEREGEVEEAVIFVE